MKNKKTIWSFVGAALALSIIAGAASGIVASIITNQSLDEYFESLSADRELVSISKVKPRPLPGTYEEALSQVREVGRSSLALIYPKSPTATLFPLG